MLAVERDGLKKGLKGGGGLPKVHISLQGGRGVKNGQKLVHMV